MHSDSHINDLTNRNGASKTSSDQECTRSKTSYSRLRLQSLPELKTIRSEEQSSLFINPSPTISTRARRRALTMGADGKLVLTPPSRCASSNGLCTTDMDDESAPISGSRSSDSESTALPQLVSLNNTVCTQNHLPEHILKPRARRYPIMLSPNIRNPSLTQLEPLQSPACYSPLPEVMAYSSTNQFVLSSNASTMFKAKLPAINTAPIMQENLSL